jgi:HEAT repeat protein
LNEDQRMKHSAIYAMGKSNNPHWIPTIVRELKSADPETRYEAANACGEMAEEDLIPDLLELFDDDDIEIQSSAVGAVGNIGGNMARRALLNTLNVSDPTLAEAAQTALAKLDAGEDLVDISINPYDRLSN